MVHERDKIYHWRKIVNELFEPDTRRFEKCPECNGAGWTNDDRCMNCEGEGEVRLLSDSEKPYATMKDGPDKYLFRKDGKQKLVGALGLETDECSKCDGWGEIEITQGYFDADHKPTKKVCPKCEGTGKQEELAEETDGYRYREERDEEPDNVKLWHYAKAPGDDWVTLDHSPYEHMDDESWELYKNFHKEHGRWPPRAAVVK